MRTWLFTPLRTPVDKIDRERDSRPRVQNGSNWMRSSISVSVRRSVSLSVRSIASRLSEGSTSEEIRPMPIWPCGPARVVEADPERTGGADVMSIVRLSRIAPKGPPGRSKSLFQWVEGWLPDTWATRATFSREGGSPEGFSRAVTRKTMECPS